MKLWIAVLIACCVTGGGNARAEKKSPPAREEAAVLDIEGLNKKITTLFEQKHVRSILDEERKKVESFLPKDKADLYMKYFDMGMRSNLGIILVEGGENSWLERVYHSGYQQKKLFEAGYLEGMIQGAK